MKSRQKIIALAVVLGAIFSSAQLEAQSAAPAKPNDQMQAVLDKLGSLGGKPIASLSPEEARKWVQ